MAKNKLRITDIQKALLTNTRFIKEQEEEPVQEAVQPVAAPVEIPAPLPPAAKASEVQIEPLIMKKMKILATYQKTTPNELINSALDHYLRLKAMQLEEAMLKLTE